MKLRQVAVHDRASDATAEAREKPVNEIPFTTIIRLILVMLTSHVRVRTFMVESGFALGRDHNHSRRNLYRAKKRV